MKDTIIWDGKEVPRVLRAYCSRQATTAKGGGRFNHPPVFIPAEYAVRDQQGLIIKRFDSFEAAEAFAAGKVA